MRVLLHAKMPKETKTEETKLCWSHFYDWWHFDWGGGEWYALCPEVYSTVCFVSGPYLS